MLFSSVQHEARDLVGTRMKTSISFIMDQRPPSHTSKHTDSRALTMVLNAGGVMPTDWKPTWLIYEGFLNIACAEQSHSECSHHHVLPAVCCRLFPEAPPGQVSICPLPASILISLYAQRQHLQAVPCCNMIMTGQDLGHQAKRHLN